MSRRPSRFDTLVMKVHTTVHRRMFLMLRSLDDPIPDPAPSGAFEIREMTETDREGYLAMLPDRRPVFEARLQAGARCFLAWDDARIAHGYWMAANRVRIDYLARDLVLAPGDIYTYDSYSPPDYRGRGLAQAVGLEVMRLARAEGSRRAWCLPAVENQGGIRPVEAIGYRRAATVHYLRLGPLGRTWMAAPTASVLPELQPPLSD